MEDYRQFVTDTYCRRGERVPALILRYYRREIEAYNEARRGLPFRLLWREEPDGEEFPSPAPERSAAVPPESGERGPGAVRMSPGWSGEPKSFSSCRLASNSNGPA